MKSEIREDVSYKKIISALSAVSVVFAAAVAFLGDIFVPVSSAALAALFLFERSGRRIFSYLSSVLLTAVCLLIGGLYNLSWALIILLALVISITYRLGRSKTESVVIATSLVALITVMSFYLAAAQRTGSFSPDVIIEFYTDLFTTVKESFVSEITSITQSLGDGTSMTIFDAAASERIFDSIASMLISVIVIAAFAVAGLTFKAFSIIVINLAKEPKDIIVWRFELPNVFAYFYIATFFLYAFFGGADSVFAISLVNLYNIFMVVFAYFGFGYAAAILGRKMRRGTVWAILIAALVLFSTFALEVLSLIGAFYTFSYNKITKNGGFDDSMPKDGNKD